MPRYPSPLYLLGALACLACAGGETSIGSTRGYILISLDTLGARHLGAYGAERDTSPFFDQLAEDGVLFENAYVQYPSTLVSHVSMFTGLYPQEHGVYPPSSVLSPLIPSLPERFQAAGFRTAGYTEAGYVSRDFGFDRGFDDFQASRDGSPRQAEKTFEKGLEFLRTLAPEDRFFLFLHTYAVHDPYAPPAEYDRMFWSEPAPEVTDSSGSFLRDVNMGRHRVPAETVAYYRAQYDAEIRYLDRALESLIGELDAMGLAGETTLVITSDHGEEFQQHGKLAHSQIYPETLHVPLLIAHPGLADGARLPELVQSIDLAPTLYELAGIDPGLELSGRSLAPLLVGASSAPAPPFAYAEVFDQENQKTLIESTESGLVQFVTAQVVGEAGGTWATRRVELDTEVDRLDLELVSFHTPREISVEVDGELLSTAMIGTDWQTLTLELPGSGRRKVALSTSDCDVPMWLGVGGDTRCLSFKLQGAEPRRSELYDLARDPEAMIDLSAERGEALLRLGEQLRRYRWQVRAAPGQQELSNETLENLKALGYLN